ncbi:MAG: hypothetical protein LZF86_190014 [Nitrospira sp.]|nr:MAG: hypothetical protein LZF86_190014 [Nitrospira sp.]
MLLSRLSIRLWVVKKLNGLGVLLFEGAFSPWHGLSGFIMVTRPVFWEDVPSCDARRNFQRF